MRSWLLALWLLLCASLTNVAAAGLANPRSMTFPPLAYTIPRSERVLLANGTPVYLLQDHELPIVTVAAMIHTGSVYDPAKKSGLAAMTGSVMRDGGTVSLTPHQLDAELEFMASSVESSFGTDSGTVTMTTLTRNLPRTLELFNEVLFRPRFDAQRLEVARRQALEAIRRHNDDPKALADRELVRAIYRGHPLGQVPTATTIEAITRSDLIAFHQRFVRPDNLIITVSGDFDRNRMLSQLNRTIGSVHPSTPLRLPAVAQVRTTDKAEILYADKDINQTVIRLGHLGITKDNPDLYAVRVLDFILGGSFTSRLMMEIRTNLGLAYNVGSDFEIGRRFTGTFTAETETRADSTTRVIGLMTGIIARIRTEPVSEQELTLAKDAIINSFLFGFTTPASIVMQQARLEFYGYAPDYLDRYRERIAAVTRADVLRVARNYLHPEAFKLVVVGDAKRFDRPLTSIGTVHELAAP